MRHHTLIPIFLRALCATACAPCFAGDLNPPPGPVAPTHKTLTEVEPRIAVNATNTPGSSSTVFRISQPGSYYLTRNVTAASGDNGIEITASGVALDLNGFELIGVPGSLIGIRGSNTNLRNITIRNGSIRNWGDTGVSFIFVGTTALHFERLITSDNGSSGIGTSAVGCTFTECTATGNAGAGISAGTGAKVTACIASDNANGGIYASQGSTVIGCTTFSNDEVGINTGFGCTVTNCTSDNNEGDGIEASNGTTISDCSFFANAMSGINAFSSVTIRNCTSTGNDRYGIDTDTACLIENSLANSNVLGGIRCGSRCVVRNNITGGNASDAEIGAGILVTGNSTRVEGNTCYTNDFGIDIDGTGSIIIRNTCTGNTQAFGIAPDNLYGPIIDRRIPTTVPSTPAAVGFSASGTMGSTDTNANFAH